MNIRVQPSHCPNFNDILAVLLNAIETRDVNPNTVVYFPYHQVSYDSNNAVATQEIGVSVEFTFFMSCYPVFITLPSRELRSG